MQIKSGKYDLLYRSVSPLWGAGPGRMVVRAAGMLSGGRAIDVGAGDGKNLVFLEKQNWIVDAIDISAAAKASFEIRCERERHRQKGFYRQVDATVWSADEGRYDLAILYGVAHCIEQDGDLERLVDSLCGSLTDCGMIAFAAINDELPVPERHGTDRLYPRPHSELIRLFEAMEIVAAERGTITEHHLPVIGLHRHAVTWGLFQKGRR